jgi:hypothetical protein
MAVSGFGDAVSTFCPLYGSGTLLPSAVRSAGGNDENADKARRLFVGGSEPGPNFSISGEPTMPRIFLALFLALGMTVTLGACGGDQSSASQPIVTDSAGIRIVTNPDQGSWRPEERWRLEEDLRIGVDAGPTELQFGSIAGLDADPSGRIYVLDGQARQVRVFGAGGDFVTSFGRGGGGPGEFSQVVAQQPTGLLFVMQDGTVAIPDIGNARIAHFGPDGAVLGSEPITIEEGIPMLWTRAEDRALYRQVRRMGMPGMPAQDAVPADRIIRMTELGGAEEVVLEVPPGESFGTGAGGAPQIRIFASEPVWTVLSDGRLVTGSNDRYSLELRGANGEVESIVRRDVQRREVTARHESSFRDIFREAWGEAGIPPDMVSQLMTAVSFEPVWPALAQFLAGPDGTLWVQRVDAESALEDLTVEDLQAGRFGSPRWDVFDEDGAYLGVVEMPHGVSPHRFVGNHLYGVHRDDLEVQRVVRLGLRRGEG